MKKIMSTILSFLLVSVVSVMPIHAAGNSVIVSEVVFEDEECVDTVDCLMSVSQIPDYEENELGGSDYIRLFDNHMDICYQEALEICEEDPTDFSVLDQMSLSCRDKIINALKSYEVQKSLYLLNGEVCGDVSDPGIILAWDEQGDLNEFYFGNGGMKVESLIPAVSIKKIDDIGKVYKLEVSEWMTIGYNDPSISDIMNFSAYRIEFSIKLSKESFDVISVANQTELFDEIESTKSNHDIDDSVPADNSIDPSMDVEADSVECLQSAISGYNVNAAVAYANQWAYSRNPEYEDYSGRGGDCANFFSQCMRAGGIPITSEWTPGTSVWAGTISQSNYLCRTYGLTKLVANDGNILIGSPVYYQWHSNWWDYYDVDHVTICVGTNSQGTPVVNGHTRDIKNHPWCYGYGDTSYMTLQMGGDSNILPDGVFDGVNGGEGWIELWGWVNDKNAPSSSREAYVHVYVGGPAGSGARCYVIKTGKRRDDVVDVFPDAYRFCGFDDRIYVSERGTQQIYVYAIDTNNADEHTFLGSKTVNIKNIPFSISYDKSSYSVDINKKIDITLTFKGDGIYTIGALMDDPSLISSPSLSAIDYGTGRAGVTLTGAKAGTTKFYFALYDTNEKELYRKSVTLKVISPEVKVSSLTLNKSELNMNKGETDTLTATVAPASASNKNVTWKSSDASVVSVSAGKLTAKKAGSATITATASDGSGKSASCKVTVKNPEKAVSHIVRFFCGDNLIYTETVPDGECVDNVPEATGDGEFKGWLTESGTIWNPSSPVKSALVLKASFSKTVEEVKEEDIDIEVTEETEYYMVKGETAFLDYGSGWISSDPKTVQVKKNSKIAALNTGFVTLESSEGYIANCYVVQPMMESKKVSLVSGNTEKLQLTGFEGYEDEYDVVWVSSNREIVRVEDDGTVYGISKGKARVSAYVNGKAYKCDVTVTDSYKVSANEREIRLKPLQKVRVRIKGMDLKNTSWVSDIGLEAVYGSNNKLMCYEDGIVRISTDKDSMTILGIGPGRSVIKAVDETGKSVELTITVDDNVTTEVYLKRGSSRAIKHTGVKVSGKLAAVWESSNEDIATVSSKGVVKGKAEGQTTVICRYNPYNTAGFTYKTLVHVE